MTTANPIAPGIRYGQYPSELRDDFLLKAFPYVRAILMCFHTLLCFHAVPAQAGCASLAGHCVFSMSTLIKRRFTRP